MKDWKKKLSKISKSIDNWCIMGVFCLFIFTIWLSRMFDWMIKFWPFFCIVLVPFLALSFLWNGFLYIGIFIYLLFCGFKAVLTMDDVSFD